MVVDRFEVDSESGGARDQPIRPAIVRPALGVSLADRLLHFRAGQPTLAEPQRGVCRPDEVLDRHVAGFYGRGRQAPSGDRGFLECEEAGTQRAARRAAAVSS
jgi:hypothetical protein